MSEGHDAAAAIAAAVPRLGNAELLALGGMIFTELGRRLHGNAGATAPARVAAGRSVFGAAQVVPDAKETKRRCGIIAARAEVFDGLRRVCPFCGRPNRDVRNHVWRYHRPGVQDMDAALFPLAGVRP